jgi:peptide/nickel transport system permease protein
MLNYIIRRLLLMLPTIVGMTLMVFLVMAISPGGLTAALRTQEGNMRPEQRAKIEAYYNKRYGLDKPPMVQYVRWLNQVMPVGVKDAGSGFPARWREGFKMPDLGESLMRHRPVLDVIAEALPITLLLNIITIPLIYAISVTAGIYAARRRGHAFDVAWGTTSLALWSIPVMWAGVMFLGLFANRDILNLFPAAGLHDLLADQMRFFPSWSGGAFQRGWLLDMLWHLTLPIVCLTYGGFAFLSKLMRASVLENLSADFARTARAKGLSERAVLFRHVLSNSVLPLITVAAGILPGLLGGSLIVESIFSINGMGRLMIEAIYQKDRELVMSETFVIGVVSLISLLIADLCYAAADPRVTYE